MPSLDVVEVVDVVADGGGRRLVGGVALMVDEFCAQGGEEALGDGIVPAIASAAHAVDHGVRGERAAVVVARLTAAALRSSSPIPEESGVTDDG